MQKKINKKFSFLCTSYFRLHQGFTLVEMLVVCLIFSIIVGAATGVFVSAIRVQRYNLTYQELLSQTSYALEYMSRAIRMAQKNDGIACDSFSAKNYNYGDNWIEFKDYNGYCQKFFKSDSQLKANKTGSAGYSDLNLISTDFSVNNFQVNVSGDESDTLQPRVTVLMEIQGTGPAPQPRLRIQTTISQRNLDRP